MSREMPNQLSRDLLRREPGPSLESQVAWYHHMQETQPIRHRPEYHLWEMFRYKDVQQVLLDYATFSIQKMDAFPDTIGTTDPPDHRRLRGLVSKAFTPRRIEDLTPRLIQIIDEWLEPAIARGKMDIVTGLTYPLPVRVLAEMLGLPPEDQERFRQWAYQLFGQFLGVSNPDHNEFRRYFSDLLNERKRDPRDDLISALLATEENGAHLTHEEIINLCLQLIVAGHVTTTTLLNAALHRLCQHPEMYQALRDDPLLIPGTIEEVLRYDFSLINVWRSARHDTVFNGHEIKAGETVVAWTAAANFDETYFPQSSQFDMKRSPNPHLTFGHGIHTCLGNPLARLEVRIVLERIAAHFSEIRPDPERPAQFIDQMGSFRVMQSLDIFFTPEVSPNS